MTCVKGVDKGCHDEAKPDSRLGEYCGTGTAGDEGLLFGDLDVYGWRVGSHLFDTHASLVAVSSGNV